VDARTRGILDTVKVGNRPQHIAFTRDGREAWITETGAGTLYVVDASSRRTIGQVDLGGPPHHVALDEGRAYVAVGPASLVVVGVQTRKVIARIPIGVDPHDVVVW
jgi:YVTN family beta-propeller protein